MWDLIHDPKQSGQKFGFNQNLQPNSYEFGWFDWFCLCYPPGWLVLFNRHWQHYKPDPGGWNCLEYGLFLLPGGFYIAVLLRGTRLAIRHLLVQSGIAKEQNSAPVESDPGYQQAFRQEILALIVQRYFRAELHLAEGNPLADGDRSLIVPINHAGMCFPWDFICLGWLLSEQQHWSVQPLAHPLFFDHLWLRWWLPAGWAQSLGGVRAEQDSFATAIAQKSVVLYAPEGWRGLAKGWRQRYQLASFDSSFVRLSVQHQVPVQPIVCIGSETLHPYTVNVNWLARLFKMPMFPISPLLPIFILFPSMGVWAVRSRLQYFIQPLWCPWNDLADAEQPPRQTVLHRLALNLRSHLQQAIDELLQQ